ncbi:MAG: hypothetical protein ACRESZ_10605 [Methylococcales bacterium]
MLINSGGHEDPLSMRYRGIDQFRMQALENITGAGHLDPSQHRTTCEMLVKKARIYCKVARK